MDANLFELAMSLIQTTPQILPELSKLLDQQLSKNQKQMITQVQQQMKHPAPHGGPVLKLLPHEPGPAGQLEKTLLATSRVVPHQQFKTILLQVAGERHNHVRAIFYFVCLFFVMSMLVLFAGILLIFINPSSGAVLTPIGTLLSTIGGLLLKFYRDANKRLDEMIDKIRQA